MKRHEIEAVIASDEADKAVWKELDTATDRYLEAAAQLVEAYGPLLKYLEVDSVVV